MYKKVYLEVTNICNLDCPFCIKNNRNKEYISIDNFNIILDKLNGYTKYLYFHLMGDALMHPNINELIDIASKNYYVNITTNGYLINKIKDNNNIRQINISMHSFTNEYSKTIDEYVNDIYEVINKLHNNTYFSLRFWVNNKYNKEILNKLSILFNKDIELKNGFEIIDNVFISINKEFIWPSLNNCYYNELGKCYALKDHIGILVNGDIVPCCLDANGLLKLGNIYKDDLDSIINSKKYKNMLEGFKRGEKRELLCKKCNFLE